MNHTLRFQGTQDQTETNRNVEPEEVIQETPAVVETDQTPLERSDLKGNVKLCEPSQCPLSISWLGEAKKAGRARCHKYYKLCTTNHHVKTPRGHKRPQKATKGHHGYKCYHGITSISTKYLLENAEVTKTKNDESNSKNGGQTPKPRRELRLKRHKSSKGIEVRGKAQMLERNRGLKGKEI